VDNPDTSPRPTGQPDLSRRSVLRGGAALGAAVGMTSVSGPATAAPGTTRSPRLVLAHGGHTAYRIVVGTAEGPVVRHAADELAAYLREITGATFPVVVTDEPPDSDRLLVVGRRNAVATRFAVDADELSDDGFALRTFNPTGAGPGRSLLIAGASDRGTLYGVYWVLDRLCGVRWFAPDYTVVPQRRRLALRVDDLNGTRVPRFRFREVFAADGVDPAYRQHNLLNGSSHHVRDLPVPAEIDTWSDYWPYEAHNFHHIVTDQDLWAGGQLKAMHPATREQAAVELVRRIEAKVANGRDASYGFSQMDWGWTPDPDSQTFADAHGGALSAPIIDMLNDVVARVRERIPQARLGTLAYQFSFQPPTDLPVSEHVVITAAPIEADFAHPLISARNEAIGSGLETWARLSANVVVWTYNTNFQNYLLPFPNWWAMCSSVRQLAELGVQGYFGQGAWDNGGGAELAHLRLWVLARLLWDPDLDADALIREFLDGYYGAAGKDVYAYMRLLAAAVEETGAALPCFISTLAPPYLTFDVVRRADALLDRAERKVRHDPTLLRHVQILRLGLDMVILLRRNAFHRAAKDEGVSWDPDLDRRIARFNAALDASGMTAFREELGGKGLGNPEWLRTLASLRPAPAAPPPEVIGRPDSEWIDYQELDFTLWPLTTWVVEDEKASSGYAVRMPGNTPDWGVQVPLSLLPRNGAWRLYAVVRAETNGADSTAPALTVGVYPPFGNEITVLVGELSDGEYHTVELPGSYRHDSADMLWVAPPNSDQVRYVYVDRVFAIKA